MVAFGSEETWLWQISISWEHTLRNTFGESALVAVDTYVVSPSIHAKWQTLYRSQAFFSFVSFEHIAHEGIRVRYFVNPTPPHCLLNHIIYIENTIYEFKPPINTNTCLRDTKLTTHDGAITAPGHRLHEFCDVPFKHKNGSLCHTWSAEWHLSRGTQTPDQSSPDTCWQLQIYIGYSTTTILASFLHQNNNTSVLVCDTSVL